MKERARYKATVAAKKGLLVVTDCEKCGASTNLHKHHEDYTRPCDVNWLCSRCHTAYHAALKKTGRKIGDGYLTEWLQHGVIRERRKPTTTRGSLPTKVVTLWLPAYHVGILYGDPKERPREVLSAALQGLEDEYLRARGPAVKALAEHAEAMYRLLASVMAEAPTVSEGTTAKIAGFLERAPRPLIDVSQTQGQPMEKRIVSVSPQILDRLDRLSEKLMATRTDILCAALECRAKWREEMLIRFGS